MGLIAPGVEAFMGLLPEGDFSWPTGTARRLYCLDSRPGIDPGPAMRVASSTVSATNTTAATNPTVRADTSSSGSITLDNPTDRLMRVQLRAFFTANLVWGYYTSYSGGETNSTSLDAVKWNAAWKVVPVPYQIGSPVPTYAWPDSTTGSRGANYTQLGYMMRSTPFSLGPGVFNSIRCSGANFSRMLTFEIPGGYATVIHLSGFSQLISTKDMTHGGVDIRVSCGALAYASTD